MSPSKVTGEVRIAGYEPTKKKKKGLLTLKVPHSSGAVSHDQSSPSPAGVADGQEHAQVAVGDDAQRDEEHKAAQHQSVTFIGGSG